MADESGKFVMEKTWERIQQKTFTKWINSHLRKRKLNIEDVQTDFSNGVLLLAFLEIISNENIGKYDKKPKIRIQYVQNVSTALDFIKKKGVKLVNISAEDVVDKNLKLILGLIWTIIQKFQIDDISEEELSAKEALLLWCKKKTAGYRDVAVKEFTYSWQDGLALCALIHRHRPDLIDFDSLDKNNKAENLQLAFNVAEDRLGIAKLLDVEDMVDIKPDERSVITYLSQFYHVFASSQKGEVAGRRIGKLVDLTSQNDALKNDYTNRANALRDWIHTTTPALEQRDFPNSLEGVKQKISDFQHYKTDTKPPKAVEKNEVEALFNNIALKLRNNNRPAFVPPEGLSPLDIDDQWTKLGKAEDDREKALRDELARQEKLANLQRRFNLKADLLEQWNNAKAAYLAVDEHVDSLKEANSKLKDLDAFDEEYKSSQGRVDSLNQLAKEILDLNPPNAHEIQNRADSIINSHKGLAGPQSHKRSDLQNKLDKETKKEELRLEFAKQVKLYNLWNKESTNAVQDHNFGLTLEEVQAYEHALATSDHDISSSGDSKKLALDDLWNQLEALGVTENRYTPVTNKDIEASHQRLLNDLSARRAAYGLELEKQRLHEEKRKEFAKRAQEFVDSVGGRREKLNSLTGEPDELIEAIKNTYQDGHAEREGLGQLSLLQEELAGLGIRDNRHTTYNLPILTSHSNQLANHVRNQIAALNDEKELKAEYNAKATALTTWAHETIPHLQERNFDNTLAGARQQAHEWTKFQTTSKATNDIDKINLQALHSKIQELLSRHHRPEFVPAPGLDVDSIHTLWDRLNAEAKAREEAVWAELHRQEKLAALVKRFQSDAEDLEAWIKEKEDYLNNKEEVNTLDDARLKSKFLEVFGSEFGGKQPALDALKNLRDEIVGLNYHDAHSVNSRLAELEAHFSRFANLQTAKAADLKASLDQEEKKEAMRSQFADLAKDFAKYVRETSEAIEDHNFGFTLEEVVAYKSQLDASNNEILNLADQKKHAVDALAAELHSHGVSDNRHTTHTSNTIDELRQQLQSALDQRNSAYSVELARQQHNDQKRHEFAETAGHFVSWIEDKKKELVALQGTPDERISAVHSIHQEGAPAKEYIHNLKASDEELKSLGVYDNKHTPYTLPILQTRNHQFETSIKNFISDLNEEKELNARAAAQHAEFEHRLKIENLKLEFGKEGQQLNFFLDAAAEVFTDPALADSVEHAQQLHKNLQDIQSQQAENEHRHQQLQALAGQLKSEGVDVPIDSYSKRWAHYLEESAARNAAVHSELARQEANEGLRKEFADRANGFHGFLDQQSAHVNTPGEGELEDQLSALQARKPEVIAGRERLVEIEGLHNRKLEAGVTSNKHTAHTYASLKARHEQLLKVINDKESLLQKEILQKKGQLLSAEQLNEFNEVFQHFAKGAGYLTKLDFKASLQSLGEDPTDADIDRLVAQLSEDGKIGFEAFCDHMTQRAADTDTQNQILDAFRVVAGDKDFVTQADLLTVLPKDKVDYLTKNMPAYQGSTDGSYDYKAWASSAFAR